MKTYSIKKILFLATLIMLKAQTAQELIINNENEKKFYINKIKEIDKNKNKQTSNISPFVKSITLGIIIAEIYNYCINKFQKSTDEINSEEPKKKKNIFEKIQDRIGESTFGNFISFYYNSIMLKNDISSILNNPRIMQLCKEELKEQFFILEQAENKLFLDTFLLTLGFRKTYTILNNAYKKCLDTTLPIIGLLFGIAYVHCSLNEAIKKKIGKEADKIDFLNKNEIIKNLVTTSGSVITESYITSPLSNFLIYFIEGCREILSKEHIAIKKGRCLKLSSEYIISNDSKELKKNKEIYEGNKTLIKTVKSLLKIFNIFNTL